MKYITAIAFLVLLSGCGPGHVAQGAKQVDGNSDTALISYRDEANKVTCYRVLGREGLSFLRDGAYK